MAQVENQTIEIQILRRLLLDDELSDIHLSQEQANFLLKMGAVLALTQDGGKEAVQILTVCAQEPASTQTATFALRALMQMAENGSHEAVDALYLLALEDDQPGVRQSILAHDWSPSRPAVKVLFDWIVAMDGGQERSFDLDQLSKAFFENAGESLQARILARTASPRYRNWGRLMQALRQMDAAGMQELVALFPALSQSEQAICRKYLQELAGDLPEAQDVICRLFVEYDDVASLEIALHHGYQPVEPYAQALFAFLSGNQERYQAIDFDHNLLITAYESSNRGLRRRLLAYSRQTGQIEWLRVVNQASEVRWLGELSDADWELAIQRLFTQERFNELWRLAQMAPPIWAAAILTRLHQHAWQPASLADREGYNALSPGALACWQNPLDLKPKKSFRTLSDQLLCMDFNPQATLLAAGTSGQPIYLWELPKGALRFPALMGPASVTRSVLFSQDGELVVAAGGDQRIRIFRHHSSQIIKTIEGHKGLIRHLAMHPNGRLLISTGFDGTIRYWRFPIGTEIKRIESSVRELFGVAIFANGEMVASGGAGERISIWSVPEGNHLRDLAAGNQGTLFLATTPASEILAVAGRDKSITIWNGINGNRIRAFPPQSAAVTGLELHPNEQLLVVSDAAGKIKILNLHNGATVAAIDGHKAPITALRLAADGRSLASADEKGQVSTWDLSTLIWLRTAYQPGSRLPVEEINQKLLDTAIPPAEKQWLTFVSALWKWIRRFEIEISEPMTIQIGEFDIEL